MREAALPDDPQALKALIGELTGQLAARDAELDAKDQALTSLEQRIAQLQLQIAVLRRARFGRRSERLEQDLAQLELKLEELQSAQAEALAAAPTPRPRQRPVRRPLPEHLPRETHTVAPAETSCPACGGALKHLGEDVTEMLEYVPASFKVIRKVRPKLACGCCDAIVQAPAPSRPIRSRPGRPGPAGPCAGVEVRRSPAAVSPERDLCA